ncbi:hypothetical protein [Kineococcus terrestris]|uniref:hypothetical protein n=1 Tax=Kineococcus terrestris TaxID=2044856 RepID=UPI0034DB277B
MAASSTASPSAKLTGAQRPRVALVPEAADRSHGEDAADLGVECQLPPDPWQRFVLECWLGVDEAGMWTSAQCGLAVPRQNGKNGALELRELYGTVVLGERFLHTAHEVKTARKAFQRLLSFFDNPRQFPELAELVKEIRRTNGQEAIVLHNGGSVEFVARSKNSGRGFSVDVLVLDEAQDLSEDALAALQPTLAASPNPQIIIMGTPPGPNSVGEVFTRVRTAGVQGSAQRLCWLEWSIEQDVDGDGHLVEPNVHDRRLWAATNPALGRRLRPQTISDELGLMDPMTFARERLGMWPRHIASSLIAPEVWDALTETEAAMLDPVVLAVDVSPGDRPRASIGVAGRLRSGRPSVEVVENGAGTDWVVDRLVELVERHDPAAIVIDAGSPAAALIPSIERKGIDVARISGRDMAAACGLFYADATQDGLAHRGDPLLAEALKAARRRPLGDAWAWNRKSSGDDITPLVSVTLARYGLEAQPAPKAPAPPPRVVRTSDPVRGVDPMAVSRGSLATTGF